MIISRFSSKKTAFPPHAILLCAWMICVLSKTGVFQTHAFSTSHRASAPCADQATVGHISSLSYLRSSPYSADSGSSPLYRRIDGAGGAGARKRRGRTATSMSQNESRNVFHEGPMRRYLRMFRSRLLPGSTNSELNSRSATPIERLGMVRGRILSGQEAERSIATTLGAVAGQDTTEGSSTVDPTPVGTAVKGRKFSVQGLLGGLKKLRSAVDVPEAATDEGRFLLMAAFVGVLTGTSVTIFKLLIGAVKGVTYGDLVGRFPANYSTLMGALVPVTGAIAVVSIMKLLRLKSYGPGLGGLTEEVDKQKPWSPTRTLGKTLAATATLGTGNSLGPEGPAVELGVAASRCVSSVSNLSVERQRMLLGAGAAGGVAAGFNAPIAGIFFALEIVKDTFSTSFSSKSFIAGTLLCAVVSALIAKIGLHDELSLRPAAYNLESPLIELPLYLGLGIVAGLVAVMFKFFSRKSADLFAGNFTGFKWMKRVPKWAKPIMMAAVTGLVGARYPQVLFFGYETLDNLLANTGQYSVQGLCLLCISKSLLTAGALGSGLVGGTFAPSLFLGATAGAAYQRILMGFLTTLRSTAGSSIDHLSAFLLPATSLLGIGGPSGDLSSVLNIAGSPAYAMVGAAAVLSALYRAPLTGSLLLFELTKDYDIVLPLMAAAGVSSLVVELFTRADDEKSAKQASAAMPRDMSLEMGLKMTSDARLGPVQLTDALESRVLTLTADTTLRGAMQAFRSSRNEFAVVVQQSQDGAAEEGATTSTSAAVQAAGDDWGQQALWAEDLWERQDLQLIGVLALREIVLALERRKSSARDSGGDKSVDLTAGDVCRKNCFTVQADADITSAKSIMDSKGVRFLPIVKSAEPAQDGKARQNLVGVLSRESVRIAGRLTETERAIGEVSDEGPEVPSAEASEAMAASGVSG